MIVVAAALSALALGASGAGAGKSDGDVSRWAPARIASGQFESHAAFDPRSPAIFFVRSTPQFTKWRIVTSTCGADGWSEPKEPPFAGPGTEADPWFTADGRTLYYISTRATGSLRSKDLDIWTVERGKDGAWGEPARMPEPVNSDEPEWFPRPANDGWLYFGSSRAGGLGKTDIWRARKDREGAWQVENAGAALNTDGDEYEPLPSPDGKSMLLMADGGLYRSTLAGGKWTPREKLGPAVNVNGSEIGAAFSPSGDSVLFARDTGAPDSGEFFLWRLRGKEAWPPECPAAK